MNAEHQRLQDEASQVADELQQIADEASVTSAAELAGIKQKATDLAEFQLSSDRENHRDTEKSRAGSIEGVNALVFREIAELLRSRERLGADFSILRDSLRRSVFGPTNRANFRSFFQPSSGSLCLRGSSSFTV